MAFSAARIWARGGGAPAAAIRAASPSTATPWAASAMPERGRGVEGAGDQVAHPCSRSVRRPTGKPPRRASAGRRTSSNETDRLPEARMPSASQSSWIVTPGVVRRDLGVAVALAAAVVERDGGVQQRCGRRHRAEDLAAAHGPAVAVAAGPRGRAGEVLARLADGGGHDGALADDQLQRAAVGAGAARVAVDGRGPPAVGHVDQRDQVHVGPDGDRRRRRGPGGSRPRAGRGPTPRPSRPAPAGPARRGSRSRAASRRPRAGSCRRGRARRRGWRSRRPAPRRARPGARPASVRAWSSKSMAVSP